MTPNKSVWDEFEDFDTAKVNDEVIKFKMSDKGDVARICFPLINPKTGKVALKKVIRFHYENKANNSFAIFQAPTNTSSQAYKTAIEYCGDPKTIYVTPILVYSTNKLGKVISNEDYELTNLVLTPTKIKQLRTLQEEYDLSNIDIKVVLDDAKFQNMTFSPLKGCGLRDGFVNSKNKQGEIKKFPIQINKDQVSNDAFELMKTADSVVAPRWSDAQILKFFTQDNDEGFDEDLPDNNTINSNSSQADDNNFDDDEF